MTDPARLLFKGSSAGPSATFDDAVRRAVAAAASAHQVNWFDWRLTDVRGSHGGVVGRTIDVHIEVLPTATRDSASPSVKPVHAIKSLSMQWRDRTNLQIDCVGVVTSSGWTSPRLNPRMYIQPPPDGIWELDYVATEPDGVSVDPLVEVSAQLVWPVPFPSNPPPRGIRVCSATNALEQLFASQNPDDSCERA